MNQQTRLHLNELRLQLGRLQKNQQRDIDGLKNLLNLKIHPDLLKQKQNELKEKMKVREKEMDELEARINSDNLESEVKKVYMEDTQEVKNKNRKKQATTLLEDEKEVVSLVLKDPYKDKKFKKSEYKPNPDKLLEKQMVSSYNHFMKACETIPDYMTEKLANMPGNKGYIWKGVWFFGDLQNERNQPVVVFEKCPNNVTKIHEIDGKEYKIYEKVTKDAKKKLIWSKN